MLTIQAVRSVMSDVPLNAAITKVMGRIQQYAEGCQFSLQLLELDRIVPLARFAVRSRLARAGRILEGMLQAGLQPYEPLLLHEESCCRLCFPPVVEHHADNNYYLIDGTHRLLAAKSHSIDRIEIVVVQGIDLPPLPCERSAWENICVREEQQPLNTVLRGLDRDLFRPVTTMLNSVEFVFRSTAQAAGYLLG